MSLMLQCAGAAAAVAAAASVVAAVRKDVDLSLADIRSEFERDMKKDRRERVPKVGLAV